MVRCAVWGSPIAHSLSPTLHHAAYEALGLTDWVYDRREVDATGFAAAIAHLDDSWRGLSLTMPLKEVAAEAATTVSDTARETAAINTLVREGGGGWSGHNTDAHGIRAALAEAGCTRGSQARTATVIGSGATARSAVRALEALGVEAITFMVRREARSEAVEQAGRAGLSIEVVRVGRWCPADLVISTVPPGTITGLDALPTADSAGVPPVLLDVVYGDGETPLQRCARARGWAVVDGTTVLLHQAAEQVRLMTGRAAPLEAMRAALVAARPRADRP